MRIVITDGPSITDPCDVVRINVEEGPMHARLAQLATIGWPIRLAVWYVCRYVNDALAG